MSLMYGIAAVLALWWLSTVFARADVRAVAKAGKMIAGILSLGAAVLLGARGRIDMALLLGGIGASLLGWSRMRLPGGGSRMPGISRVRSALIEMELDHGTGAMDGTVLAGQHAGKRLNQLDKSGIISLVEECRATDPDGLRLLEAYLDRRFAGWREHAQSDGDARTGAGTQAGAMTDQEAYQILGLEPGAGADDIRRAHRTLMKKLHPDQGGTTYLAARVNEAKEILLSRHR
ncbi:DnaJ domain-containing protein [Microvirga massiliensis]|uniref:DnaJ domain-containing protein n=1 Tax=Microvirga massiliensis TaxID=1033741 RepID=UPI00062BC4C1|nr:DnaJ domain-containing protein [Microvirga massiliensis]